MRFCPDSNIEELSRIYSQDPASDEHQSWIAISDSKSGEIATNIQGGSGGDFGNGWKVHISIDPSRISDAVILISQILNEESSPRVSIKFAGKELALSGQPSKQAALCFYEESLSDSSGIAAFFNKIDAKLNEHNIGLDSRAINSVARYASTKWDNSILYESGESSRFHYRNEDCTVLEDWLFNETANELRRGVDGHYVVVKDNYILQDQGAQVKQSFFETQKKQGLGHNPVQYSDLSETERQHANEKYFVDPFAEIKISPQMQVKVFEVRPFKFVRGAAGYHPGFAYKDLPSQRSQEEFNVKTRRLVVGAMFEAIGYKVLPSQEKKLQEERDKTLEYYEILLREGQQDKLKALIEQHKDSFTRLQKLDDKYDIMCARLKNIETSLSLAQLNYTIKSPSIKARKDGFFSNIKFNLNATNKQEGFNKVALVIPGICLGLSLIILGSILLIPTIHTFLLPLPIVLLSLGISLIVVAFALVHQDRQEARKEDIEYKQEIKDLTNKKDTSEDELFNAYNEIRAVNFTSC